MADDVKKDDVKKDEAPENQGVADLIAQNKALIARLEKLEAAGTKPPEEDLSEKARQQREADEKKAGNTKQLEAALRFNMQAPEFLKTNASLLPKEIPGVFAAADKETYADAIEKDAALKSAIIQEFFKVQSNLDLLTPGLKATLDDYLKLTKNGKADKAQQIYDSIFEPTFEMLKRLKKAEALGKGFSGGSTDDDAYKNKMMNLSKKHYLGEKANGT